MNPPTDLFDREWEWEALARFSDDRRPGATLGIVSGRRRQGKSFLLQALCEASGGFYHEATLGTEAEELRRLGGWLGEHTGSVGPILLNDWREAVRALLGPRPDGRSGGVVVIDELPYLIRSVPSLPSIIQAELSARGTTRRKSRARLLLCGSAMSVMGGLLAGGAPLRGRAGLELVVRPFDYRTAARFWGLERHLSTAFLVHAIVGGTPAYRREFVRDDAPTGPNDFDSWVVRAVLDPSSPLLREGRYLLAEEPEVREHALYHSALGAIAGGATRRGEIASALGRTSQDVGHVLGVLEDIGFVERREDAFRARRPTWHITEPFIAFHHAVIRPRFAQWVRPGRTAAVWAQSKETFRSRVIGPRFEELCRSWTLEHAAATTVGGAVTWVGSGALHDPAEKERHEIDVVARGLPSSGGSERVLLIGEAKWGRRMTSADLDRLRGIRAALEGKNLVDREAGCRLALFSGKGFDKKLRAAEIAGEVVLVDLERLYRAD